MIELVKIVLHLLISGTSTAGVGDIANFAIGCAFILPAAWIYKAKHSRKSAMIGMAAGTVFMAFIGCFLNAYVLLPAYAKHLACNRCVGRNGNSSKWSYYEFTYICRICSSTI